MNVTVDGITLEGSKGLNQDVWGIQENFFWVIDGATRNNKKENLDTKYFVSRLNNLITAQIILKPDIGLKDLLNKTLERLKRFNLNGTATIALVKVKPEGEIENLILGDCGLIVETNEGLKKFTDNRLSYIASDIRDLRQKEIQRGNKSLVDTLTKNLLEEEGKWRNREGGFWVLEANCQNPEDVIANVKHGFQRGTKNLLLMTDGVYNELKDKENIEELFKLYLDNPKEIVELRKHVFREKNYCDDMTLVSMKQSN